MKKLLLIILSGTLFIGLAFQLSQKKYAKRSILTERFPNGYVQHVVQAEDSYIKFTYTDVSTKFTDAPPCEGLPMVSQKLKNNREVKYEIELSPGCVFNKNIVVHDLEKDGKEEIITEWYATAFGSGGSVGLVVWKFDNNGIVQPFAGFPDEYLDPDSENNMRVINRESESVVEFASLDSNFYFDYQLFEEPPAVYFARYIWDINADPPESHFGPHIWELNVFEFKHGKFVRDEGWNSGKSYITDQKVPVDETGYEELGQLFIEKMK